jgi:hypothetical protein
MSRIQVYDAIMHVFKLFKAVDSDEFKALISAEREGFVADWWDQYMDECRNKLEAIILPRRARDPIVAVGESVL